jgi:hypothetical protein
MATFLEGVAVLHPDMGQQWVKIQSGAVVPRGLAPVASVTRRVACGNC